MENEDYLKSKAELKNEDNLQIEDDFKNEDNIKNEDNMIFCLYSVSLVDAPTTATAAKQPCFSVQGNVSL